MIGIYKITNPNGKIYIGQSINIEKRFYAYSKMHCRKQPALYASLIKHGIKNHKFEILCECIESELNAKERYYQDLYDVINVNGLNCRLTRCNDRSGKVKQSVIDKRKFTMSKKIKITFLPEKLNNIYTQNEYAKKLGVTKSLINQLVKKGRLNLLIVNGAILIKTD